MFRSLCKMRKTIITYLHLRHKRPVQQNSFILALFGYWGVFDVTRWNKVNILLEIRKITKIF